jgi:zinc transport system ATP-binding protein
VSECKLHCLKIQNIGVTVGGKELLGGMDLHAHCGEMTALIGRNGAGKSTLLKAILGEIPHSGTVEFSGHNGTPVKGVRPRIGYVPQSLSVDRHSPATVCDMLLALTSRHSVFLPPRRKEREALADHLERFHARHLLESRLGGLSGGELQRVLLAAATLPVPDLLILDEPVSGVDRNGLREFYRIVEELKSQEDLVILLVSHDLPYVRHHADRVVLLDKTVLASGTPEQVFETEAFAEAFGKENTDD